MASSSAQPKPTHTHTRQHNTTQHNTTQHNTTQHNTTQHNTTQHNTTQLNTTQPTQHKTTQHNTTQHSTAQHNATQHSAAQHKATQHSTTHRNTAQRSAAQEQTKGRSRSSTHLQAVQHHAAAGLARVGIAQPAAQACDVVLAGSVEAPVQAIVLCVGGSGASATHVRTTGVSPWHVCTVVARRDRRHTWCMQPRTQHRASQRVSHKHVSP
jgi:hypothetical protein